MISVCSVGGYSEVGKNMTAIKVGNEAVILDMGFYLPAILDFEEGGGDRKTLNKESLIRIGAIPNDNVINSWAGSVKAIVLGHVHLDHIGAVPILAPKYNAPVIGTQYTIEVLKSMMMEDKLTIKNKLKAMNPNSKIQVSNNITIELINVTHSTLQTAMIAIHTKEGTILYANDFKFDNHPIVGKKSNIKRLKELGKENVKLLIVDSLYSNNDQKTPSEKVAREMLKDVLLGTENSENIIFATTFASHLARLSSLVSFGKSLNRKIIILGRSMEKYIKAAERLKLVNLSGPAEIIGYSNKIKRKLKGIAKSDRPKYMVVCTGGQGEPSSVMNKILTNKIPFEFLSGDHVIFSNSVIPAIPNMNNRKAMEESLKKKNVRIFKNIHVSVLPDTEVVVNNDKTMKIKRIDEIQTYEKVKVPAFNPTAKIKWYDARLIKHNYSGKIFYIKTKSGRNVSVTSGHSLFRLKRGVIESLKSDNLMVGDYLVTPKRFSWRKELNEIDVLDYIIKNRYDKINYDNNWIYHGKKKITSRKIKLDKYFAKILGYYLAEGSSPRGVSIAMGSHEKDLIKDFLNSAKKVFPLNTIINKGNKSTEIIFGANILGRIFKRWFNSGAKNKKIPDFVFSANEEFKLNFLGAYLNGDASPDDTCGFKLGVKTASKKLASDIVYLCTQLGISARFDHIESGKESFIANSSKMAGEPRSYVIRIQNLGSLLKLKNVLCSRFDKLFVPRKWLVSYPPDSLPLKELNLDEIEAKKNTGLKSYINCLKKGKTLAGAEHIDIRILKRDAIKIKGITKKIVDGDLAFDPIVEIKENYYSGLVYDFEVPEVQNFIGGFGGLFLHNSGHCSREDIRDLISMVQPQHIIPGHGYPDLFKGLTELCGDMGYDVAKNVHIMHNGHKIEL